MSLIVRLDDLSSRATSKDIRSFFAPLKIPYGAIHIGGEETHVKFQNQNDVLEAIVLDGMSLCGQPVYICVDEKPSIEVRKLFSVNEENNAVADSHLTNTDILGKILLAVENLNHTFNNNSRPVFIGQQKRLSCEDGEVCSINSYHDKPGRKRQSKTVRDTIPYSYRKNEKADKVSRFCEDGLSSKTCQLDSLDSKFTLYQVDDDYRESIRNMEIKFNKLSHNMTVHDLNTFKLLLNQSHSFLDNLSEIIETDGLSCENISTKYNGGLNCKLQNVKVERSVSPETNGIVEKNMDDVKCYQCGRYGHISYDCPKN